VADPPDRKNRRGQRRDSRGEVTSYGRDQVLKDDQVAQAGRLSAPLLRGEMARFGCAGLYARRARGMRQPQRGRLEEEVPGFPEEQGLLQGPRDGTCAMTALVPVACRSVARGLFPVCFRDARESVCSTTAGM
jgi:hypothetical protein